MTHTRRESTGEAPTIPSVVAVRRVVLTASVDRANAAKRLATATPPMGKDQRWEIGGTEGVRAQKNLKRVPSSFLRRVDFFLVKRGGPFAELERRMNFSECWKCLNKYKDELIAPIPTIMKMPGLFSPDPNKI